MAACTTTYFESGRRLERARCRAQRRAAGAAASCAAAACARPEFHFVRHFDNSRLVKAADPVRVREMRVFSAAVGVLFSLVMVYGLQHFYAIESSYRVEQEKQTLEQLREENRQLAPGRGRAHPAGPHRHDGPPAWTGRAAARTGGSSQRAAGRLRSCRSTDGSSRGTGADRTAFSLGTQLPALHVRSVSIGRRWLLPCRAES